MKLRVKIPLLLVPVVVLPLLLLGWIAFGELRHSSQQKHLEKMESVLDRLSTEVQARVDTAVANIELFSRHTLVKNYVLTEDESERYTLLQRPLLRLFKTYQAAYPNYYEIRIVLPDGSEDARLSSDTAANMTEAEAESKLFRRISRYPDDILTTVLRNPDNGRIALYVSKRLSMRNTAVDPIHTAPRLRGYLILTIDLGSVLDQIRNAPIGQQGFLFATGPEGEIALTPATTSILESRLPEIVDSVDFDAALLSPKATYIDGVTALVSARRAHPDLHVYAVLPELELLQLGRKLGLIVALVTLVAIVLTAAFMLGTLEMLIVRPIQRLRKATSEVGRGNLVVQISVDSKDEIGELTRAFRDMGRNLQRSDEQIRYIAYHDNLTGLPNRAMFREYLQNAIAHAKREKEMLAVLFLDVDDFKRVNDTLGHHVGDALLREVADRLMSCLREEDYVAHADPDTPDDILARLGGDEFIILLSSIDNQHAPGQIAQRLIRALSEPFAVHDHEFYIGASIGITLYPDDGEAADELIKNADIAMYHSKQQGKNTYHYFQESMNVTAHQRMALENKLRKALEQNQFMLEFQPQYEAASGKIAGVEALARWRDSEGNTIPPSAFIPVAEDTGLILEIGEWVIREACRYNKAWQNAGLPKVPVAVNVSNVQFSRQDLVTVIADALRSSQLDAEYLEIEITESSIMTRPDRALKIIDTIKSFGVRLSLDDFGTGYSSLSYLRQFPIDTLKIDRGFIRNIASDRQDAEIVSAIIAMAHSLNLKVVAEGIETGEQVEVMSKMNCDILQGYYLGRPVSAETIRSILRGDDGQDPLQQHA